MAEGGRILHHLKNNVGNPKNLVLFVGYAAEHTLARRIMDGAKEVNIFGEKHTINCKGKNNGLLQCSRRSGRINRLPASKSKRKVKKHIPGARRREAVPRFKGKISHIGLQKCTFSGFRRKI